MDQNITFNQFQDHVDRRIGEKTPAMLHGMFNDIAENLATDFNMLDIKASMSTEHLQTIAKHVGSMLIVLSIISSRIRIPLSDIAEDEIAALTASLSRSSSSRDSDEPENNDTTISVGDVVCLKSGGPKMTVNDVSYTDKRYSVECVWFDGREVHAVFDKRTLTKL